MPENVIHLVVQCTVPGIHVTPDRGSDANDMLDILDHTSNLFVINRSLDRTNLT